MDIGPSTQGCLKSPFPLEFDPFLPNYGHSFNHFSSRFFIECALDGATPPPLWHFEGGEGISNLLFVGRFPERRQVCHVGQEAQKTPRKSISSTVAHVCTRGPRGQSRVPTSSAMKPQGAHPGYRDGTSFASGPPWVGSKFILFVSFVFHRHCGFYDFYIRWRSVC